MNLEKILQDDARIWDEDVLSYPQLFNLARKYDKDLLEALFNNKDSKNKFFIQVGDSHVFKYNEFRFYLEENQVNDSFTQYANKIGLSSQGEHLSDSTDYVLDWPYKDCVLEGGMSSEEDADTFIEKKVETTPGKIDKKTGTVISPEKTEVTFSQAKRKREEIFYNNIIADKEIDRLLDKKALKNFTRYTAKGEEKVKEIKRDEDGTIKENLLIKGNNLLALHSLKEQFAGKVKLIYIDPPYNTGNDGFAYNDRFNHSTWLTFMKNRLEIAKEFLREDGVIFVQIDNLELAYLKVIMDQIFGANNSLPIISIKTATPAGFKVINPGPVSVTEYLLVYAKSNRKNVLKDLYIEGKYQKDYTDFILNFDKDVSEWKSKKIKAEVIEKLGYSSEKDLQEKLGKEFSKNLITKEIEEFALKNSEKVFATKKPHKPSPKVKDAIPKSKEDKDKFYKIERSGEGFHYMLNGRLVAFYSNKVKELDGKKIVTQRLTDFWGDLSWYSLGVEGGVQLNNGKKPETLLRRILELSSEPQEIVLDFHLGSGTTAAVAHKTGRQYIGIEQMNYGENSATKRLNNVINGDSTGISKAVNWKGGGDFIYFELAEYNEEGKNKIDACKSYKELKKLFTELTDYYFLNYNVSVKQFNDQLLDDKDFQELPLEEQKTLFKALLDNNQLYIPHKEQEDGKYNLSKEDQELTNEFYG